MAVDRFAFSVTYQTRDQIVARSRFNFSPSASAPGSRYYFRAYDSGTAGMVYWGPYSETSGHSSPSASETTPNYTGSLSNVHVWLVT